MTLNMDKCKQMIIMLHECSGIGWHTVQKAVAHKAWETVDGTSEADWLAIGFGRAQAETAARRWGEPFDWPDAPYIRALRLGAAVLTPYDEEYPEELRRIPQPPWAIYALGRLELLTRPSIAIVGTRNPSAYGRHTALSLSEELSRQGLTVVSGLARGIDSKAHEAALRGDGSTIAILASPVDHCYPPENRSLYQQIMREGLIVSEAPIGSQLHPGMFPLRNRIIAGTTLGTLVVEAAKGSGSLITADQALEMGRDVFAVPGPISSPKSEGPNSLIREGAKLVSSASHILEEYSWLAAKLTALRQPKQPAAGTLGMSAEEHRIIDLLRDRPLTINELHQLTMIPFGHLSALLINLCIKRKIEQQPGAVYIAL
ncbi:DNA-processing protein DprA [Paenibacillus glycanilyticus]|uniref:DNA processing protein DprA n=1 Tax=Paenibacillus glycanilyticus TaxID=126569 RepID=A0ABQ6GBZ0_9BACL|nr:DNA-processing protein DprA [Paenibacillus glycanilyticus]GLX68469.1 DNA processing protein DprA [Paenibacillus glycanilyticus]